LEALPAAPTIPGPLPIGGQALAALFGTVAGASNSTPIVIQTVLPHNLTTGVTVTVSGCAGNSAANTTAVATVLSPTSFSLPVTGNGAWTGGGLVTVLVLAQSVILQDPSNAAAQAALLAAAPAGSEYGLVTRNIPSGTQPVSDVPSAALYAGTQAATGSGVGLNDGTSQPCVAVTVQNDPGSASPLLVGNSALQPWSLKAGDSLTLVLANVSLVYVRVASGTAAANWLARG